jgi:hypothetical protein
MEQYSTPTTTAESGAEGRLKVDAGSNGKKKKIVKSVVCSCKKDGKGGVDLNNLPPPGYGKPATTNSGTSSLPISSQFSTFGKTTRALPKLKLPKATSISSAIGKLNKRLMFGKALANSKSGSLKRMLKINSQRKIK